MNDPHVVALIYRIKHGPGLNYDRAEPLLYETPEFTVRIQDRRAKFELNDHYATTEEARAAVEPYIAAWELSASLQSGTDEILFEYDDAEIIDKNPDPGVNIHVPVSRFTMTVTPPTIIVGRSHYPHPSHGLTVSPDVESMHNRYRGYRAGKEPLASMAYFCLTVLESSTHAMKGRRNAAAKIYRIHGKVLDTLGALVSEKGGQEARKRERSAISPDFTEAERKWIDQAVRVMIQRVAQYAHRQGHAFDTITMAELPALE